MHIKIQIITVKTVQFAQSFILRINGNRFIIAYFLKTVFALQNRLAQPANFYGVGGMKIFRDLIYLMQGFMKADHKFFKSHGQ